MAKKAKKSTKRGTKDLVLALICVVFGVLLFCSMFMPMIASKNSDETKISAVDVVTAMGFADITEDPIQHAKDIANASEEEIAADRLLMMEDAASKTKAAAILNLFASILGGLLVVSALLSMIFRFNLLRTLTLGFGGLATLCAIGAIICVFVLLGTEIGPTKLSENMGIHASTIIAIISGIVSTTCAWLKK